MYVAIFESRPQPGCADTYIDLARALRDEVAKVPGFISVERFTSVTDPGKYLALSFWESEQAIARWRSNLKHEAAQTLGIAELFADYRIRVAKVERDYYLMDRAD